MRGGEKVLEVLCEILPDADLYTMVYLPGSTSPTIENRRIVTSWLNRLPAVGRYYRYLLPLMPVAARRLKLRGYDLVVATSHCVAHGVDVEPGTRFVCYCFTPMRYAWEMLDSYFSRTQKFSLKQWALRKMSGRLQAWDQRAAQRVTEYVTDCRNIHERVKHYYGRDSAIIYPPVDTEYYHPLDVQREDFYLWVGAMAPYKRLDLALAAFQELGRQLVVIGEGQDFAWARKAAPENVRFLGWQPDAVLRDHYARCRALIFPGEEDFGIVPLEAQACGCPVIAYGKGGAIETVVERKADTAKGATGVFFPEPTPASLVDAVRRFEERENDFDPDAIRDHALRFDRDRCKAALKRYIFGPNDE